MIDFSFFSVVNQITAVVGPRFLLIVEPLLGWFRKEDVAPTIATAMFAYAIWRMARYWLFTVLPARRTLNRPIGFLEKIETREMFAERFGDLDGSMGRKGFLKHGWEQFYETVICREPVVEICVRPSVFLNADDAEHDGLKIKSLSHLSSIFISLGLLFTFIGLVAALSLASGTINQVVATAGTLVDGTADTQAKVIQQALAELLKTASFKFWTSIAGLLSGIVVGIVERIAMHSINGKFDELNHHLERVTLMVTPEILADRTYREIREQTAHMKDFTTQFRFNITESLQDALIKSMPSVMTHSVSDALTNRMPTVMFEAMAPVVSTLEGMTNKLTSMNEDAIKQMTGDFSTAVSQSAGTEIKAVAETMSLMPAQISEAVEGIREASIALNKGMNRITEAADRNLEDTRQKLDTQLDIAVRGLSDVVRAVRETMEQVGQSMRRSGEQAGLAFGGEIAESVKRIEQATEENALAVGTVVDKLVKTTTDMTVDMASESAITIKALRDVVETMARTVVNVTDNLERGTVKSANDVTERFLSAAVAMQEAVNRNSEQVAQTVESIVAAGRQAEMGVSKAAEEVAKNMAEKGKEAAKQVVSGSDEVLSAFKRTVDRLWQRVEELTQALEIVEQRIGSHAAALADTTRAAQGTGAAMSTSAIALTTAIEPITRTSELMMRSMTAVGTSVSGLVEGQHEAGLLVEGIHNTVSELQKVWVRHIERFDGVDASLEVIFQRITTSTNDYTKKLTDYIGKIDSHVEKIVGHLSGNVDELQSTVDAMTVLAKTMKRS
ncbi:conserved hypothetical protein [Gammaproteobacteria bacterium]